MISGGEKAGNELSPWIALNSGKGFEMIDQTDTDALKDLRDRPRFLDGRTLGHQVVAFYEFLALRADPHNVDVGADEACAVRVSEFLSNCCYAGFEVEAVVGLECRNIDIAAPRRRRPRGRSSDDGQAGAERRQSAHRGRQSDNERRWCRRNPDELSIGKEPAHPLQPLVDESAELRF